MPIFRMDRGRGTVSRCPACIERDRATLARAKALPSAKSNRSMRQWLLPAILVPPWFALLLMVTPVPAAEVGIASIFYDRVVACPPYRIDPYKVVGAAHKTLPCGTLVEVVNKLNGRRVTVPIVDKGPCTTAHCQKTYPARVRKRIFDMLPRVARAIGSSGLTLVSLTVK